MMLRPRPVKPTAPWNGGGPAPKQGNANPPGMPQGPSWPVSKGVMWGRSPGTAMIGKVVPCSQIPAKYKYNRDLYYCDRLDAGEEVSKADTAYSVWKGLVSIWPPTKPCVDDVAALTSQLQKVAPSILPVKSCTEAKSKLEQSVPNFGCDEPSTAPLFRDLCCSVCGGQPIPNMTAPSPAPPAPPAPPGSYKCSVCQHVYDPDKDGGGKPFEDLPDTWRCPVCQAPKSAYKKSATGEWLHTEFV